MFRRTVGELREWLSQFGDQDFVGVEDGRVIHCFDRHNEDFGGLYIGKAPTKICPLKPAFRDCTGCGYAEGCKDYRRS